MTLREKQIYLQAILKFGGQSQLIQTAEECGELITEIMKYENGRSKDILRVAEELVDVEIMVGQMRCLLDPYADHMQQEKERKLKRLQKMINDR